MARLALLATAIALTTPCATAVAGPPPASAFGTNPAFDNVSMSPDGALIAMDHNTPTGQRVVLLEVGNPQPLRAVNIGGGNKLRRIQWADNDTVLLEISMTTQLAWADVRPDERFEVFRIMAVNARDGEPRVMLFDASQEFVTGADLLPVNPLRKDTVSMTTWDYALGKHRDTVGSRLTEARRDDGWVLTLFDVDTNTGKGHTVALGTPYTVQWMVDPDGAPVARVEWKADTRQASILVRDGLSWRTILQTEREDPLTLAGFSPDGTALIGIGEHGTDRSRAWALPLDGSPIRLAFEDPELDVGSAVTDPTTGRVVGYWTDGPDGRIEYVDPQRIALSKGLAKAFPDRWFEIVDRSTDGQRLLIRTESSSAPAVFYLLDRTTHRADIVGETYPALANVQLGEVRTITYPARDGTQIPAFLTLPPGAGEKNLPLVVLVHGGPEAQDPGGFDWWAQFLASRGYAVLQPQFRGSTGYGAAHRQAGYGQWGGLMQDDVTDGARHLIGTGLADPKRVCIMGASYGGYAALAGATFTPELYACAVSVSGVSDLPEMLGHVKARGGDESNALAYWKDHIGSPNDPKVAAASPARSATKVRAPILLIYGTDDTVVPPSQTLGMAKALDAAGRKYEIVTLPGEDHWLSNSTTRIAELQAIEAFLAKNL
ncbi:MAG: S9 family peptidase [Steroidobacteraceae bacterium]